MRPVLLMILPFALLTVPALAAAPDEHKDHHPPSAEAAPAKPEPKGGMAMECPMMGKMAMAKGAAMPGPAPQRKGDKVPGGMMMKDMHCMPGKAEAKPQTGQQPGAEHDHGQ